MTSGDPALSVVIPAFNEENRLPRTLERIQQYFSARFDGLDVVEVLVVDDGSTDATARIAQDWAQRFPGWRLVSNLENRGKGYSVRHGMLVARGRIALFTDADLSSPIEECEKLLAAISRGNDFAIGSRALDRSLITVRQARYRELAGIIFNGFVRILTGLPFYDTQCGFKAFLREPSAIVFEQQRIEGFGFDPEILFLAKRHGLRGEEVAVRWAHDPATKVQVVRDSIRMFGDLLVIRCNALLGRYPRSQRGVRVAL